AASADGAALQDILSVARRRFPLMTVKTAPCRAQGPGSAKSVAEAVRRLDAEPDVEAIIVARGGGSIEDLWAFNEEILARAIAEAGTPVVSGVGHEIDFTIADFVADYRAATPTAAMEALTIDRRELRANIKAVVGAAGETLLDRVEDERAALKTTLVSRAFRVSEDLLAEGSQRLDRAAYRIQLGAERKAERARNRLELFTSKIMAADPNAPLKRGFVLAEQDGKLIGRASNFSRAKDVLLRFYDGEISLKRES
ncbi:MAG: exodeoxyribonuclease VII large subunit, partial [Ignavibacteriales bacterium]|nr:exodeoxyribonuclease VII large subunit [Ignavibacteriales bacterium]